jgi:hypothetical protein
VGLSSASDLGSAIIAFSMRSSGIRSTRNACRAWQSCLYIDSDPIDGIGYQIDIFEEWRRWGDSQLEYAAATRLQLDDRQTNGLQAIIIPILRLSDLRLPNRGGRWT